MSRDGPAVNNEEALDKATLGFAAIIESSDIAIYSQDLDGIITSWNRAAEKMFGYQAAEVMGQTASATIIPPDQRAQEEAVLQRTRAGQGVQHYDTVRQRKDGRPLHVAMTVSPVRNPAGEIVGLSKIARDITEQRRTEYDAQRLAAIVKFSDDAIVGKDLDGTIRSWNRAAEEMFGFSAAEAIGQSIRLIVPEDREEEEEEVLRRIQTVRRRLPTVALQSNAP